MGDQGIAVGLQIRTPEIRRELEEILASDKFLFLQEQDIKGSCDLLIVEIEGLPQEFDRIKQITGRETAPDLFVTSRNTSAGLLLEAMRAGVKEFFSQPLNRDEIKTALTRVKERRYKTIPVEGLPKKGKLIHVLGSKGGVGKTTLVVNLAASLIELEDVKSVAVWDMNSLTGDVPVFLSVEPAFNWLKIAGNVDRLDSTYLMSSLSRHPSGIHILPAPAKPVESSKVSREMLEILSDTMSGLFDYTIVDCGPDLYGNTRDLLRFSDLILLLVVLNLPCLVNLKRLLSALDTMGYSSQDKVKIVANRLQKKSLISMPEAEKSLNRKFLAGLPNDYQLTMSAINQGRPISAVDADSELCRKFRELACLISGKSEKKKKSLFGLSWMSDAGLGRKLGFN